MPRPKIINNIKCSECKKVFWRPSSSRKFCSTSCWYSYSKKYFIGDKHSRWKGGKKQLICEICDKKFCAYYKKTCSRNCSNKRAQKIGSKRGSNNGMWNGGKMTDKDGYISILRRDHPFCNRAGYVREHRLVVEKHLGRYLGEDEVVHHINGVKSDNRISNLKVMTNEEHSRLHTIERHRIQKLFKSQKLVDLFP